uniref:non-specific protein-tyrosine kinase n=1 Tax=Acrobeloides nanus TaxID=290746 RepID=A0A914CND7_9BILA
MSNLKLAVVQWITGYVDILGLCGSVKYIWVWARVKKVKLESESDAPSDPYHPDSPCLIHRDDIKLLDKLGAGSFGIVKHALWTQPKGQTLECAIKVLRGAPSEVKNDLINEVVNMQKLSHPNLVRLYGIVFGADDTIMVVELCAGGALIDRLIDAERPVPLVTKLIEYAKQIAAGMEYLEKMRHLEDNSNYYTMSTPKRVPFAWCAPESLRHRQFSHKSDVWSFGVTLWELFTYGEEPWLGYRIAEVLRMVEQGKRMEKPQKSNGELYHIMDLCWKRSPEDRPNFTELRKMLAKINFPLVTCHVSEMANSDLTVLTGDKIFVVENVNSLRWYGQNERTGKFGYFSSAVARRQNPPPTALPDPNEKPKFLDIPTVVIHSSGQMRIHEVRDDAKNLHTGLISKQNLHISHSSSAQQLPIGEDDRFSQVQLRWSMLLSEAKNQSEVIIKPKLPGATKKLEERPETSTLSSQLRNPHESTRMPIVTAPVMDALSRSQDGYEIPVNARTAHNMNISGPSSSAAHATAPYASPRNSGVVLGFEHYT